MFGVRFVKQTLLRDLICLLKFNGGALDFAVLVNDH